MVPIYIFHTVCNNFKARVRPCAILIPQKHYLGRVVRKKNNGLISNAGNEGSDQPAHTHSLIGTFVVRLQIHRILQNMPTDSEDPDQTVRWQSDFGLRCPHVRSGRFSHFMPYLQRSYGF